LCSAQLADFSLLHTCCIDIIEKIKKQRTRQLCQKIINTLVLPNTFLSFAYQVPIWISYFMRTYLLTFVSLLSTFFLPAYGQEVVATYPTISQLGLELYFHKTGQILVTGYENTSAFVWNIEQLQPYKKLQAHASGLFSSHFSNNGHYIVSSGGDKTACIWDSKTGKLLRKLEGHTDWVQATAWSHDDKIIATGCDDRLVRLFDAHSGKLLREFKGYTGEIDQLCFSSDGKYLATGNKHDPIKIWNIQSGAYFSPKSGVSDGIHSLAFSPDGTLLAAGENNNITIWNLETGEVLCRLQGHKDWVDKLAFSPDGQFLASCAWDYHIKIWEVHTNKCIFTSPKILAEVVNLQFSPDGKALYSSATDKTVRKWAVANIIKPRDYQGPLIAVINQKPLAQSGNSLFFTKTNKEIDLVIEVQDTAGLKSLTINGREIEVNNQKTILISEKVNLGKSPSFYIIATDNFDNRSLQGCVFIEPDSQGPDLIITEHKFIEGGLVQIEGIVDDPAGVDKLRINGYDIKVKADKTFVAVQKPDSHHLLTVAAWDFIGNSTVKRIIASPHKAQASQIWINEIEKNVYEIQVEDPVGIETLYINGKQMYIGANAQLYTYLHKLDTGKNTPLVISVFNHLGKHVVEKFHLSFSE